MGRLFGFVGLLMTLAIGYYIYSAQLRSMSPAGASADPAAAINAVGVQNDLMALANAERRHMASAGKYVSLDELVSAGDIATAAKGRGPCAYDADIRDTSFRIIATCRSQTGAGRVISIDETMQIRSE